MEMLDDIERWTADGVGFAVARVVELEGSAPRQLGATMAVTASGEVAGSVSGGCVESAVVAAALDALDHGGRSIAEFGCSDDEAFSVGLTCGGSIRVFIEPFDWAPIYEALRSDLSAKRPVALATVVEGPETGGKLLVRSGRPTTTTEALPEAGGLERAVRRDARSWLLAGRSGIRRYGVNGEARQHDVSVFIQSFTTPPRMLVLGAVDFAAALASVSKLIGYQVAVCDARASFATPRRFPMADEVVVSWPHQLLESLGPDLGARDAVCVLTHDPKFDVPAITAALATGVGYIGVMGSRRTHDERTVRLRAAGVTDAELERIRSPVGLDIGAVTPEETAISIVSEVIAERSGRGGRPLSLTTGPIHGRAVPELSAADLLPLRAPEPSRSQSAEQG